MRVEGANQVRRDFADSLNSVGKHDEEVVGIDPRHPHHGPDSRAGDGTWLTGIGNMWCGDGRRFGDGVEQ